VSSIAFMMNRKPLTPANLKAFGLQVQEGESEDTVQVLSTFMPVEVEMGCSRTRTIVPAGQTFSVSKHRWLRYPAQTKSGRRSTECQLFTEAAPRS
jgi:hypothetical protein